MIWFTSDSHFGHFNIIRYCNRPFTSTWEMNCALMDAWNAVVGDRDIVYHLGDFLFAKGLRNYVEKLELISENLNGRVILVPGNHDKGRVRVLSDFFEIEKAGKRLKAAGRALLLDHYPSVMVDENCTLLHGHSHGTLGSLERNDDGSLRRFDVGVDSVAKFLGGSPMDYRPIAIDELPISREFL